MRILVVEDKQEWMEPLVDALKALLKDSDSLQIVCEGRETAKKARELLDRNKENYDIAILDLRLEEKPNIHYLNLFTPDVFEGIEIYEKYNNILGKVMFSAIPENIKMAADAGFNFPENSAYSKDFSWNSDDSDQYPENIIEAVKKIISEMQSGNKK